MDDMSLGAAGLDTFQISIFLPQPATANHWPSLLKAAVVTFSLWARAAVSNSPSLSRVTFNFQRMTRPSRYVDATRREGSYMANAYTPDPSDFRGWGSPGSGFPS